MSDDVERVLTALAHGTIALPAGGQVEPNPDAWRKPGAGSTAADGTETASRKSNGSRQEFAANALQGMSARQFEAVKFYALEDMGAARPLRARYRAWVDRQRFHNPTQWPGRIRRGRTPSGHNLSQDWLPDLVELALMQILDRESFKTQVQRAQWFGVTTQTWRKQLERAWQAIQREISNDINSGLQHIVRRSRMRA
ncbi:MAG: hypothetical protein AAFR07_05705 [Pseudomonadota bacterium]